MADDPNELEALKRENRELRELLAHSRLGTELYQRAAYETFNRDSAGPPPTDEEIEAVMRSPSKRTLHEALDAFVPRESS